VEACCELLPLQAEHGKNTCCKEMGLNLWNIALEAKYKIILEHGKEDMSITCRPLASKLPHHQSVVAKKKFPRFHPLA
jgi:hypothetical protein